MLHSSEVIPNGPIRLRAVVVASFLWLSVSNGICAEQDDLTYHALVQRVNSGDLTIDFRALRLACIKASDCEPRGTKKDLGALNLATDNHVLGAAVEVAERMVQKGFVNIEAHMALATVYAQMNEPARAKFHMDVLTALMRSIFLSGDGKTKETAFEVICDREEYIMMAALGLPSLGTYVSGESFADGPHRYDKRQVADTKTSKYIDVFFNTDAFSPTKSRAGIE
jgi:hypothetical protein